MWITLRNPIDGIIVVNPEAIELIRNDDTMTEKHGMMTEIVFGSGHTQVVKESISEILKRIEAGAT